MTVWTVIFQILFMIYNINFIIIYYLFQMKIASFFFSDYSKNMIEPLYCNSCYKNTLAPSKMDYCIMLGGILSTLHTPLAVITNRHCRNFAAPTQPFGRNVEPSIHAAIWSTSFVNWKLLTSWHVGSTDALGPDLIRAKYELSWEGVQCKVIQTGRAINYVYTEVCGHSWTFSNSSEPTQTLFDAIRKFHPHRAARPTQH